MSDNTRIVKNTAFLYLLHICVAQILSSIYVIALGKEDRVMVHSFIRNKILKK